MIGRTVSHFSILSRLGHGGMGEVYRARDAELGRDVAIKMILPEVADDPERLARFEREARVLASLNHPNVATLYALERAEGSSFLVMELVEGETLEERLARGPMSVEEAVPVFLRIADGLQAAHDRGIVHRDLKPANIKLTPEGDVKILDFGLAKVREAVDPDARDTTGGSMSQAPTRALGTTAEGAVLGTAAYMAPEQIKGAAVDQRVDVWAFGACLFEVLAGRRPFAGDDARDVVAATLTLDPAWQVLPPVGPSLERLLRRCLTRDPRWRLRDIADARLDLEDARQELHGPSMEGPARPSLRSPLAWALAGLLVGVLATAAFVLVRGPERALPRESGVRLRATEVPLLAGTPIHRGGRQIALSPDGEELVFAAGQRAETRLYRRRLDRFEIVEIPGSEGGQNPFFSPDGQWIAFVDDEHLKKVPTNGGSVQILCEAPESTSSGAWTDDGWIYFTYNEDTLARVPADGGERERFLGVNAVSLAPLPGGRLLVAVGPSDAFDRSFAPILVASADETVREVTRGHSASWMGRPGSSRGHLLIVRGSELMAAPFDLDRLELEAEPRVVQSDVWTDSVVGWAQYVVSDTGSLAYVAGPDIARTVPTWIDRDTGEVTPMRGIEPAVRNTFHLSPDQDRLLLHATGERDRVEVFDLALGTTTRLSREGGIMPVWSQDGSEVFYEPTSGPLAIVRVRADRSGEASSIPVPVIAETPSGQPVPAGEDWMDPVSVSPDGRYLVTLRFGLDLWLQPLDGEAARPLLATSAAEVNGVVSPDGRWLAYQSNEEGDYAIYVTPFPSAAWSRRVSSGRGDDPRWSPAGGELFYRDFDRIYRIPYSADETEFIPRSAELVVELEFHNALGLSFDVSLDGRRFLVNRTPVPIPEEPAVAVIEGWRAELERLLPLG